MFEKVNPSHPDKVADRIAGAIVDYAYSKETNPRIAVEVLIGHGTCTIIAESSVDVPFNVAEEIVSRITGEGTHVTEGIHVTLVCVPQDSHLAENQSLGVVRCGDNGIFKGMPVTFEQKELSRIARSIYKAYPTDGKYVFDMESAKLIVCQSQSDSTLEKILDILPVNEYVLNPLGDWTGGTWVDCGATNRKLGSDMADSITGGGLHGKDLSKADVSVNIYAWIKAQATGKPVELYCAIGDTIVDGRPYGEIVNIARQYIKEIGGFEKFAEWGLV